MTTKMFNNVSIWIVYLCGVLLSTIDATFEYGKCFDSAGCFGIQFGTTGDCITERNCDILVTYQNQTKGKVAFTIKGNAKENEYIALGLSETDDRMGNDSVMFCYNSGVGMSWNLDKEGSFNLKDKTFGLSKMNASLVNGILSCKFTRDHITIIEIPNTDRTQSFNLSLQYFFLVAKGTLNPSTGKLEQHQYRGASKDKIRLHGPWKKIESGDSGLTIIKAHGTLMIIAWMFFSCIGTFTARYMFNGFPENAGFYWFQIHQICMSITWLLSIAAVLVQFIGVGPGPLSLTSIKHNPHSVIGLISVSFMFIQPFMGFLRPPPHSGKREIFNRIHQVAGYFATVFALSAIVLATFLKASMIQWESRLVAIGFVLFYALCHASMTIHEKHSTILKKAASCRLAFAISGMISFICTLVAMVLLS